jgi:hypothetical protein
MGRFTGIVPIKAAEMEKGIGFATSEWEATVSSELKRTFQGP